MRLLLLPIEERNEVKLQSICVPCSRNIQDREFFSALKVRGNAFHLLRNLSSLGFRNLDPINLAWLEDILWQNDRLAPFLNIAVICTANCVPRSLT